MILSIEKRGFMKKIFLFIFAILLILFAKAIYNINKLRNVEYSQPEFLSGKKILTVYYSKGGNTKNAANNIHYFVGGDMAEIKSKEIYSDNFIEISKTVRKQAKQGYMPEIENIDISKYDIIFIGSPIWNFSTSLPVKSFLKNNNFKNKTLIPFYTCDAYANKNRLKKEVKDLTNIEDVKNILLLKEVISILKKEQIINWLNKL